MAFPSVSVVMCTYNGAQFIDEQVASVLGQTYPLLELIIQDDGSTDGTWEKLEQWAAQSPLVKLYRNPQNLGYNRNFEKAIPLAKGELISLADQDDIWLPEKVARCVAAFTSEEIILVHNRSVRLENGQLDYKKAALQHHFSGNDTRRLLFFNQIMGHDMMFRAKLVPFIVPVPAGMSYDWWIAVVATCVGSVVSVGEYLVHHRIHGNNNFFSNTAASKKKELDIPDTLALFATIPVMKQEHKDYLSRFLQLLQQQTVEGAGFNSKLFLFFLTYRKIIFGHKRRALPELSYFKNALKYSKMNYRGRGMSI